MSGGGRYGPRRGVADTRRRGLSRSLWAAHSRNLSAANGDVHGTVRPIKGRSPVAPPRRVRVRSRRNAAFVAVRSSGHSNPWEQSPEEFDPDGESGAGAEFTLATTEAGDWAIRMLQSMLAFDILRAGRFPGKQHLALNDRIPLRAPLNGDPACVLRNLVMTGPEGIPTGFQLPSGKVLLAGFTAISDDELKEAKQSGSPG